MKDIDAVEALYHFWSSFGIPAYQTTEVPDNAEFPYISFEVSVGTFDTITPVNAYIWDRTKKGTAFIDKKAEEIREFIKHMGCPEMRGGRYRAYVDGIYAQTMGDPDDKLIKRKVLTVNFEFMTK